MKIALIGYGNVGQAFAKLIVEKKKFLAEKGLELELLYAIDSGGGVYSKKGLELSSDIKSREDYTTGLDIKTIVANKDADILVELTPTDFSDYSVGLTNIRMALESGMHVVTGNKAPIAAKYRSLKALAHEKGVSLGVGCCCGGALAGLNAAIFGASGAEIFSIEGVLNGTTNYMLKEMEKLDFGEALEIAKSQGIVEKNYRYDIDGYDTAVKLLIISNIALNLDKKLDDVEITGISGVKMEQIQAALKGGEKIKLIGKCEKRGDDYRLSVAPESVKNTNPLYFADGKNKGIVLKTDCLGQICVSGGASGTLDAAGSALRDIVNIWSNYTY